MDHALLLRLFASTGPSGENKWHEAALIAMLTKSPVFTQIKPSHRTTSRPVARYLHMENRLGTEPFSEENGARNFAMRAIGEMEMLRPDPKNHLRTNIEVCALNRNRESAATWQRDSDFAIA